MILLSSTDLAISIAKETGTLRIDRRVGRYGETYWAISDDRGLIEIASSEEELERRTGRKV